MLFFVLAFLATRAQTAQSWKCILINETVIADGVTWKTENCSISDTDEPLLRVNSIHVDLLNPSIHVVPGSADVDLQLQTIPDMATHVTGAIAGINGGYFWRVDVEGVWVDDVCRGKTRKEAEMPVSDANPNYGVGDGLVRIDGLDFSHNCDCKGYSRPAVMELDGVNSKIEVLYRGETINGTIPNAIAAGPNLVSYDSNSKTSYIDIPDDDDNINIYEHAANAAVGVVFDSASSLSATSYAVKLIMATTDGSDECGRLDTSCGLNSHDLASLMKDHFQLSEAMSMDQGGSTTMWINGVNPDRNGVVSRSHSDRPESEDGPRSVANGLFVQVL